MSLVVASRAVPSNNFFVPKTRDDKMRSLIARYDAAYSAHRVFAMAIAEFAMADERPPDLLQDSEKEAARELEEVTAELRAAMAERVEQAPAERELEARSALR